MNLDPQIWDLLKLLLSFVGALVIAWLAVRWALRRYQREKAWERRFNAYSEAIAALSEMRLITGLHIDALEADRPANEDIWNARQDRYSLARRQLEQVIAISGLLFPDEVVKTLSRVMHDTDPRKPVECGIYGVIAQECSLLDNAIRDLNHQARKALGLSSRWERQLPVKQTR